MLVGVSEAAAGRRPWTGHMTARRLVWFLGTEPARQFRARRAGGRLNWPWSVCCTSQLPSETLVRQQPWALALGRRRLGPSGVAGRMSRSPASRCLGHTCACKLPSSDPKTWCWQSPASQTVLGYDLCGSVCPPCAPVPTRELSTACSLGTSKLLVEV